MKRCLTIALAVLMAFSLTACMGGGDTSSKDEVSSTGESSNDGMGSSTTGSDGSSLQNGTNDSSASDTADTGLRDGTYKAEGKEYDSEGYKPYVELTVKNGKIAEIECDAVNKDGKHKREDNNAADWLENMKIFEQEVIARGLENITIGSDGSVTDIKGLDFNLGEYGNLIKEAADKAREA